MIDGSGLQAASLRAGLGRHAAWIVCVAMMLQTAEVRSAEAACFQGSGGVPILVGDGNIVVLARGHCIIGIAIGHGLVVSA